MRESEEHPTLPLSPLSGVGHGNALLDVRLVQVVAAQEHKVMSRARATRTRPTKINLGERLRATAEKARNMEAKKVAHAAEVAHAKNEDTAVKRTASTKIPKRLIIYDLTRASEELW